MAFMGGLLQTVNFDPDGYPNFTYTPSNSGIGAGGNPNDCFYHGGFNLWGVGLGFTLTVDLGVEHIFTNLQFDAKFSLADVPGFLEAASNQRLYITLQDENHQPLGTSGLFPIDFEDDNDEWKTYDSATVFSKIIDHVRYISIIFTLLEVTGGPEGVPPAPLPPDDGNYFVYLDNIKIRGFAKALFPSNHDGPFWCEVNSYPYPEGGARVSLDLGEKREEATDLALNTPAGPLAFTRTYRQSKLVGGDEHYQFMGLGWTHNHRVELIENTGTTPPTIVVLLPNGGEAHFTKTAEDFYQGDPGSTSFILVDIGSDYNPSTDAARYTLKTPGGSIYLFDSDKRLRRRRWPTNGYWDYNYDDITGNLEEVVDAAYDLDDGEGVVFRKLLFSYDTEGNEQLYRVTDHTGRYVEFGYTLNADESQYLLTSVTDVRDGSRTWLYQYYGQEMGEDDPDLLDLLVEVQTPSVDSSGDGTPDGRLTRKRLTYSYTTELAVNGGMEEDSGWNNISGAAPSTNERSNAEVEDGAGLYARHVVASADGQGIEGNSWTLVAGRSYAISARVKAVSGTVKMAVTGEGAFDDLSSGSSWQTLQASHTPSATSSGHKLQFTADGGAAEFYVDSVSIVETSNYTTELVVNGGMEQDSGWHDISGAAPSTNERSNAEVEVGAGLYARHVVASAAGQGIEGNSWTLVAGRSYTIAARVKAVSGTVKMAVTGEGAFDDSSSGSSWQTLQASHTPTATSSGHRLQFTADGGAAEFYVDSVSIVETNPSLASIREELGIQDSDPPLQEIRFEFQPQGEALTRETSDGHTSLHHFPNGVYTGSQDPNGSERVEIVNPQYRPVLSGDANGNQTLLGWSADGRRLTNVADALANETRFDYHSDDTLSVSTDAEGRQTLYAYENQDVPRQPTLIVVTTGEDLGVNGGMEEDSDWSDVGSPTLNTRVPAADGGLYLRHVVASGDGDGIETHGDYLWDLDAGYSYTIRARIYPISGLIRMQVSGTSAFDQETSEAGAWRTFSVTHTPGSGLTGRKLQFVAVGGDAEFYLDSVSIRREGEELAFNGGMEEDGGWADLGTVVTQRVPGADAGQYARRVVTGDADDGMEGAAWDLVEDRAYLILARVFPVSGTVKMHVTGTSDFDTLSSGTGKWETLRAVHVPESSDAGVRLQFLADGGAAEFYVDSVRILDSTMILRWQEFSYNGQGQTLAETLVDPAAPLAVDPLQQVTRSYHASGPGNGLLHQVTQRDIAEDNDIVTTYTYDSLGRLVKTQQNRNFGSCEITYTVYDDAGQVVATLCNYDPDVNPDPTTAAEAVALYDSGEPDKNRVTTYAYDEIGRRVAATVNAGAVFAQTTLTAYDALDRVIRTIGNYQPVMAITDPYIANHEAFDAYHGTDETENLVADTAYNARGRVESQTDVLGNVTRFVYDASGRLARTIANYITQGDPETDPADWVWDAGDNRWEDGAGNPIAHGDDDQNIISEQLYDPAGNRVKTVDSLRRVTYTAYDALNRPVKTIRSASDADYDILGDLDLSGYTLSDDPDRDLVETTVYDALGRVIRSARLLDQRPSPQWDYTLFGYDPLGRQVKAIRSASNPAYDSAADPDLSGYNAIAEADLDILSRTFYDAQGRVSESVDALGRTTRLVYDGLGRQVKTIANYIIQGATDPADWVWDAGDDRWENGAGNPIDHGANNDQNIITTTSYDGDGRVEATRDVLGRVQRSVYDSLGRVSRTIANYVAQGATDPAAWIWDAGDNRWEDGAGNPIDFGADNDQNRISETEYDAQGRVLQTFDHHHNSTYRIYDILGRQVKTITNYTPQGDPETDPADWVWDAGDNRWEDGEGNAIDFGADNDQNRISATVYDLAGRVSRSRDALGIETRYTYDALGRRIQTVVNYVDGVFSSAAPDEDLSSASIYDLGGQLLQSTDARGTRTAFGYDHAGRRRTVTQAADSPLASTGYTCYDKAGRALRTIANWSDDSAQASPDAKGSDGHWLFAPQTHGPNQDQDLIVQYQLDRLGRSIRTLDPLGNQTLTVYDKDGQVRWLSDPEYSLTHYRYDSLRRRIRVVQGYLPLPDAARLAFVSFRDGNYEIYTMDVNGDNALNISGTGGQDYDPDWSPDGSRIVFTSDRNGGGELYYDLYVMDADGDNLQRLTDLSQYPIDPTWSPAGGQIVFSSKPGARDQLYLMNADGSNLRLLFSHGSLNAGQPAWSPDGSRIAFFLGDGSASNIYLINADGTQPVNLTHTTGIVNTGPAWSPDGRQIAFQSNRDGNTEIYLMDADGGNLVRLTDLTGSSEARPCWSPDGTQIAFHSNYDGDREIYTMDADGSNVVQLTENTDLDDWYVDWTPRVIDPKDWEWAAGEWQDGDDNPIPHGTENDRNIIVAVAYDAAGRMTSRRDPNGHLTTYQYDQLNRRLSLTNALSQTWLTEYADLANGGSQTSQTYPGVNGGSSYPVQRDFDRLGRLASIAYGDPSGTPDVKFAYDVSGIRTAMTEYSGASFTSPIRQTQFGYDDVRRLTSVGFDHDGGGSVDETVGYEYDAGGLRTKLTLPGSLDIIYAYDARGRLISLTDWDGQPTQFAYDGVNRHIVTQRANGFDSRYRYDAAGRLKELRHHERNRLLGRFLYALDRRGNRVQAVEQVAHPAAVTTTIDKDDLAVDYNAGTWSDAGDFKTSVQFEARMKVTFTGQNAALTLGTGDDHSIFDIYIDGSLWQSFDGYAASSGERIIHIALDKGGTHVLALRNRPEKHPDSTGYRIRFKQVEVLAVDYDQHTIQYAYDALSRLRQADYNGGERVYDFAYDPAGNRLAEMLSGTGVTPANRYFGYNAANQLIAEGETLDMAGEVIADYTYEYDANGNLRYRKDTVPATLETYTWNRANRLVLWENGVAADKTAYAYDGLDNRVSRAVGTTSPVVTQYLLDLQPGLAVILGETQDANTTRYIHGPRGIHAHQDSSDNWEWMGQDGLGSVRSVVGDNTDVLWSGSPAPYGEYFDESGTRQTNYGFTGEPTDPISGLLYLRARDYNSALGVFTALDPFEGTMLRPMSLNGFSYVEGSPVNLTDRSGLCPLFSLVSQSSENCLDILTEWAHELDIWKRYLLYEDYKACVTPPSTSTPTPPIPAWNTPAFTTFPIDLNDTTSGAYQDLFGNGADSKGARGCRLFAAPGEYPSTGYIHPGFDYYVPSGTEVKSISDGIVVGITRNGEPSAPLVGSLAPEDVSSGQSTVIVRYGYSYVIFAHLGTVSVTVGDRVSVGNTLGSVGQYDDGFGSHLHLEVRNFSQALSYEGVIASGIEAETGVITEYAISTASPLLFVNPYQYFDPTSQQFMDLCVGATYTSNRYPSDFERPNGAAGVTPATQNTRCFEGAGNTRDFEQCNQGLVGAPR